MAFTAHRYNCWVRGKRSAQAFKDPQKFLKISGRTYESAAPCNPRWPQYAYSTNNHSCNAT